jgi:hypothetical protein
MGNKTNIEDGSPASKGPSDVAAKIWQMAYEDVAVVHDLMQRGIREFVLDPTLGPRDRIWVLKELAKIYGILIDKQRSMVRDHMVVMRPPGEGAKNVLQPTTAEAVFAAEEQAAKEEAEKAAVEAAIQLDQEVVQRVREQLERKKKARADMDKSRAREKAKAREGDKGDRDTAPPANTDS